VRGVPWSVRCGYLRSFDFGSYYQSTPRAAAVRVQLVQGSSGTCFYRVQGRCMFLAVHSSPVACGGNRNSTLFTRYRNETLPWRRGLPRATGGAHARS